jgi:hypothetical protein
MGAFFRVMVAGGARFKWETNHRNLDWKIGVELD